MKRFIYCIILLSLICGCGTGNEVLRSDQLDYFCHTRICPYRQTWFPIFNINKKTEPEIPGFKRRCLAGTWIVKAISYDRGHSWVKTNSVLWHMSLRKEDDIYRPGMQRYYLYVDDTRWKKGYEVSVSAALFYQLGNGRLHRYCERYSFYTINNYNNRDRVHANITLDRAFFNCGLAVDVHDRSRSSHSVENEVCRFFVQVIPDAETEEETKYNVENGICIDKDNKCGQYKRDHGKANAFP